MSFSIIFFLINPILWCCFILVTNVPKFLMISRLLLYNLYTFPKRQKAVFEFENNLRKTRKRITEEFESFDAIKHSYALDKNTVKPERNFWEIKAIINF